MKLGPPGFSVPLCPLLGAFLCFFINSGGGDIYRDKHKGEIYQKDKRKEYQMGENGEEYEADKVKHNRKRFLNG